MCKGTAIRRLLQDNILSLFWTDLYNHSYNHTGCIFFGEGVVVQRFHNVASLKFSIFQIKANCII